MRDRRTTLHWGWANHIRGIGVGYKRTHGKADKGSPCITVYVRRKFPNSRLPANQRIPEDLYLASLEQGFLTDIIELRGPVIAHSATNIQPGDDVAHKYGETGTLGLLVRMDGTDGILAASCSHVLARSGISVSEGDAVEHPPLFGEESNEFGHLTNTFTRLNQNDLFSEDFALAKVDVALDPALATNGVIVTEVANPINGFGVGLNTSLHGIHTNGSPGHVLNPSWSGVVNDVPFAGDVQFEDLVPYETPCVAGDSGGVVLELDSATALGFHVAGSTADQIGFFMPLWSIFKRMGLKLVTTKEAG